MNDIQKELIARKRYKIIKECKKCEFFENHKISSFSCPFCRKAKLYFVEKDKYLFKRWFFDFIIKKCVKYEGKKV